MCLCQAKFLLPSPLKRKLVSIFILMHALQIQKTCVKLIVKFCSSNSMSSTTQIGVNMRETKHMELFWRVGPLYYRLPSLGEYSRSPPVSAYQLALL